MLVIAMGWKSWPCGPPGGAPLGAAMTKPCCIICEPLWLVGAIIGPHSPCCGAHCPQAPPGII